MSTFLRITIEDDQPLVFYSVENYHIIHIISLFMVEQQLETTLVDTVDSEISVFLVGDGSRYIYLY